MNTTTNTAAAASIALLHGYFLSRSGSEVYVRELARACTELGANVTIVCQEPDPLELDFVDEAWELGANPADMVRIGAKTPRLAGRCRVVRPFTDGRLLVFAPEASFEGFESIAIQHASPAGISSYVDHLAEAVNEVTRRWQPDLWQANHLVPHPAAIRRASLVHVPYAVTFHGSELTYSISGAPQLIPLAAEGLAGAGVVTALSEASIEHVRSFALQAGIDLEGRTLRLPPGVDAVLFRPNRDIAEARASLPDIAVPADADLLTFVGSLRWSKGPQHAIAAMPLILQHRPGARLLLIGEGPESAELERLVDALDRGDLDGARRLCEATGVEAAHADAGYSPGASAGPVVPVMEDVATAAYREAAIGAVRDRVIFAGRLPHERIAPILAASDLGIAPSIYPEAFGLVVAEAASSGAIPVAAYHSGLREALDVVTDVLGPEVSSGFDPRGGATQALAAAVTACLDHYPTKNARFRASLHAGTADHFSWHRSAAALLDWRAGLAAELRAD